MSFEPAYQQIVETFRAAQRILIISHRNPDADSIGSNIALRLVLENVFHKEVVSACVDAVSEQSFFLPKANMYVQDFDPGMFDVFVSVDCGGLSLVRFQEKYPEILDGGKPFINIDHHASNDFFGTVHLVEANAAATTKVLYDFFRWAKFPLTKDISTALLYGLYFDTGSFMHSNTNSAVLMMAGDLQRHGADLEAVTHSLFRTLEPEKLRLWGRVLERAQINDEGITISAATLQDMKECDVSPAESLVGVVDYLNSVPNSKFCLLLSEDGKGTIKGSLRTLHDDVNVSEVAASFQGGGHRKASGFGITGKLELVEQIRVVPQ